MNSTVNATAIPGSTEITLNVTLMPGCPIYVIERFVVPNDWDDPIWILTSAFVIFTMQSGFGLLESGTATSKNEVNIMVKNAVDVIFGGITYWMVGYAVSFGDQDHPNNNAFSGYGNFFLDVAPDDQGIGKRYSHFIFQLAFATTATTIVSGAMVERTRLEAYIIFSLLNTFISSFPSHWVWAEVGFLKQLGVIDVAGGGPVHIAGGVTGLVATLMLKPRNRRYKTSDPPPMGSPTNAILGMFMLWWGWLGFNCGSTQGITNDKWSLAARSAVATICSSMAGGISGITLSYLTKRRKFDIGYLIDGVLGALVSITAMCTQCPPSYALLIGLIGGCIACGGVELLNKLKIDDPVGVVPVHFFCGTWSLLSAGLFTKPDGLFMGGGFKLLGVQLLAVVCISAWCSCIAFITLTILSMTIGLRFPFHEELLGADIVEHSIGPRKYDKIKKRLTDSSRHRRFDELPRRRMHSSMRQAEDFLNMQDTVVNASYEDILKRFHESGNSRRQYGCENNSAQRQETIFKLSNGRSPEFNAGRGRPGSSNRRPSATREEAAETEHVTNRKRKLNAQLIRGAFRRRKIVLPKWQRKLGIENVAYMQSEQSNQTRVAAPGEVHRRVSHDVSVQSDPSMPRRDMVDQATQTDATSDTCSASVQTSAEEIFLTTITMDAECSSIELDVCFEADDRDELETEVNPRKKNIANKDTVGGKEDISNHTNARIEYLV